MARVKRSVNAKKKRREIRKQTKGYYGARSRTYKYGKEQVYHSLEYQYRDRRAKKRDMRRLWITRINAAARLNGLNYSQFMHGIKLAGIELDRKVLAQMAYEDLDSFNELAEIAKKALAEEAEGPAEVEAEEVAEEVVEAAEEEAPAEVEETAEAEVVEEVAEEVVDAAEEEAPAEAE